MGCMREREQFPYSPYRRKDAQKDKRVSNEPSVKGIQNRKPASSPHPKLSLSFPPMLPSPHFPSPPPELIQIPPPTMPPPPPKKPKPSSLRRPTSELIDVSYKQLELFFQISSPIVPKSHLGIDGVEEEECRTPNSYENKLSPDMAGKCPPPPPPPVKRWRVMRCKRCVLKEECFVEVGMEELKSLFRPRGSPAGEPAAGWQEMVKKKRRVMP